MVGYAGSVMPDPFPWLSQHYLGILDPSRLDALHDTFS
jgi:hypothetical protein